MSEKCRFSVVTRQDPGGPGESGEPGEVREQRESSATPQLGTKRRYHDDGVVGGREELWSLHDVIFTDRVQSVRVGRVVKIDGLFAAVHFPVSGEDVEGESGDEVMEEGDGVLERCRLLRKDDLVVSCVAMTTTPMSSLYAVYSWQQNR